MDRFCKVTQGGIIFCLVKNKKSVNLWYVYNCNKHIVSQCQVWTTPGLEAPSAHTEKKVQRLTFVTFLLKDNNKSGQNATWTSVFFAQRHPSIFSRNFIFSCKPFSCVVKKDEELRKTGRIYSLFWLLRPCPEWQIFTQQENTKTPARGRFHYWLVYPRWAKLYYFKIYIFYNSHREIRKKLAKPGSRGERRRKKEKRKVGLRRWRHFCEKCSQTLKSDAQKIPHFFLHSKTEERREKCEETSICTQKTHGLK